MAEPTDMIVPLLREMRTDWARQFDELKSEGAVRHAEVIARLDRLEATQVSFKQALSADSLLSKLVTGEFEGRIGALETKVRELEGRR